MSDADLIASNIEEYLARYDKKELLRFVAVGSVDDGKSTLIGRLLYETEGVYEDQLEDARRAAGKRPDAEDGAIDFALITDGLRAEREQGITIDVAYRYFHTDKRKFIIADTPGHVQYTRNMATGASTADVAIILIDARQGVVEQSKRHAYIASLLGIPHLFVAVNKMDLRDWERGVFESISETFAAFARRLRFLSITFIPVCALRGDNVVRRSEKMPWYTGGTLLEHLETVPIASDRNFEDLRFPVQTVIRPNLDYRGFAGQVVSGVLHDGDPVMVLPSGKHTKVVGIDTYDGPLAHAFPPQSIVVRLADEIDISRGDMLVRPDNVPRVRRRFDAMLVWMSEGALDTGRSYFLKQTTQLIRATVERVPWKSDPDTLAELPADRLALNEIGRVTIVGHRPIFFDPYTRNRATGAFVVIDAISNNTVGAGMILDPGEEEAADETADDSDFIGRPRSQVPKRERQRRLGQKGAVVWVTGLPAAGKSTIAYALERRLFDLGHIAVVVDPDDTASSFDPENTPLFAGLDRLKDVAEFARRAADAGLLVVTTFVTPSRDQRARVRRTIGDDRFFEVYIATPEATCRARDTRGTWALDGDGAIAGQYEAPQSPVAKFDTTERSADEIVEDLVDLLSRRGILF